MHIMPGGPAVTRQGRLVRFVKLGEDKPGHGGTIRQALD